MAGSPGVASSRNLPLDKVYEVLNAALASEIICVMRYRQHYYMTTSIHQAQLQARSAMMMGGARDIFATTS